MGVNIKPFLSHFAPLQKPFQAKESSKYMEILIATLYDHCRIFNDHH